MLARTLEAASKLPGADAALIRLEAHDKPIIATLGLSAEEAERQAIAGPPDGRPARSIEIVYRYPEGLPEAEELVHSGLAVPLADDGGRVGYLTVFTRTEARRFEEEDVRRLEELALRAGPAIENARRFREARQLADLDGLTGLHNRRYFHETLAREVARAHRYNRKAALIVFDLDDFKDVNDRIGHLAGDAVLAEAAERVRDVVRSADIACRVGGDEFAVILPESGIADAQRLHARIQGVVSDRPIGAAAASACPPASPSSSPATTRRLLRAGRRSPTGRKRPARDRPSARRLRPSRATPLRSRRLRTAAAPVGNRHVSGARRSERWGQARIGRLRICAALAEAQERAGTASGRRPPAAAGRPSRRWRWRARRAGGRPSSVSKARPRANWRSAAAIAGFARLNGTAPSGSGSASAFTA